jgi:hypothetical protein
MIGHALRVDQTCPPYRETPVRIGMNTLAPHFEAAGRQLEAITFPRKQPNLDSHPLAVCPGRSRLPSHRFSLVKVAQGVHA